MGRARARRGDPRRQGRRRHGAQHGRMGKASAGRGDRVAAADGNRQDRRQRARTLARGRAAIVRHPRARPDPGFGRPDLGPHPGRARRRRDEDHRAASAEYRLPGIRHRPRQIAGPSRSAPAAGCRDPARAGARGRRVHPGLPAGHARQSRPVAGGIVAAAAGPRLCVDVRLQPCRSLGLAPRLRHRGADRERDHHAPGRTVPRRQSRPAILSGLGYRLLNGLSDGVRRDGGAGPAGPRRRQLAGAHLAGADRALAGRSRPDRAGGAPGGRQGALPGRDRALVDRERHPGRAAAPSGARPCGSPRPHPIGRAPRPRSAITSRCGRPAPPDGAGFLPPPRCRRSRQDEAEPGGSA